MWFNFILHLTLCHRRRHSISVSVSTLSLLCLLSVVLASLALAFPFYRPRCHRRFYRESGWERERKRRDCRIEFVWFSSCRAGYWLPVAANFSHCDVTEIISGISESRKSKWVSVRRRSIRHWSRFDLAWCTRKPSRWTCAEIMNGITSCKFPSVSLWKKHRYGLGGPSPASQS